MSDSNRTASTRLRFADKEFKNKTQALKYFKEYLHNNSSIKPEDYNSILALFSQHPFLQTTTIKSIEIAKNYDYGKPTNSYKVYYIINDLEQCDFFSPGTAINQYNKRQNIIQEFRESVVPQILEFKNNNVIPSICPLCNNALIKPEVDHYPLKFRDIVNDFMTNNNISFDNIQVNNRSKIIDTNILNNFSDYHKSKASYRIICHHCNNALR